MYKVPISLAFDDKNHLSVHKDIDPFNMDLFIDPFGLFLIK
jgi:hypothetical protein